LMSCTTASFGIESTLIYVLVRALSTEATLRRAPRRRAHQNPMSSAGFTPGLADG
jgi:hypothetical protein